MELWDTWGRKIVMAENRDALLEVARRFMRKVSWAQGTIVFVVSVVHLNGFNKVASNSRADPVWSS